MKYIVNALSLNMLAVGFSGSLNIQPITLSDVSTDCVAGAYDGGDYHSCSLLHDVVGAVGHANTAAVIDAMLGLHFTPLRDDGWLQSSPEGVYTTAAYISPTYRTSVTLAAGDVAYVAQFIGPRLPEGATALPEGATIVWYKVTPIF